MILTAAALITAAAETTADETEGHQIIELHFTAGELLLTVATLALVAVTYMLWKVTNTTLRHEADRSAEVATHSITTMGEVADNAVDSIENVAITRSAPRPPTFRTARATKVVRRFDRK
jgi:hypothetical protein